MAEKTLAERVARWQQHDGGAFTSGAHLIRDLNAEVERLTKIAEAAELMACSLHTAQLAFSSQLVSIPTAQDGISKALAAYRESLK